MAIIVKRVVLTIQVVNQLIQIRMIKQEVNDQNWHKVINALKEIAEAKGVSHYEIAERTGLFRPNVTRAFSLRTSPNLRTLSLIALALGAEIDVKEC